MEELPNKSTTIPYEIQHQEDGVYLMFLAEPTTGDAPLPPPMILHDLTRRGITGLRPGELVLKLRQRPPMLKVADAQPAKSADGATYVAFGKEGAYATLWLLPPVENGVALTAAQVIAQLHTTWGVTHGLQEEAIAEAVAQQAWMAPIEAARCLPPTHGEDGYINLLFETNHDRSPQLKEDGSVDYKNMRLFTSVQQGDTVAVRMPPTSGTPGRTVQGKEIPPQPGKPAVMPKAKGAAPSPDGNTLIAEKDGRVDLINGRVLVSDKYVVQGDADLSVGNVSFAGDVYIGGGVISGLTIESSGNIEINEVVEGATLIAGNDIILKKGIQGMDKAVLKAGGNIVAKFIERASVQAGGSIYADYITHSDITVEGKLVLKGKHGKLIGGIIRAGRGITAHTLGTPTGEKTLIEVGATPQLLRRQEELAEKIASLKTQLEQIDSMARIYGRKGMPADQQAAFQKLLDNREPLQQSHDALQQEMEQVKDTIAQMNKSSIHVYGEAFHDVKITVNGTAYTVRQTIPFATFRYKNGEIIFGACELNNRGE